MRIPNAFLRLALFSLLVSLLAPPAWAQQTQKRSDVEFWPVGDPPERPYRPWDPYTLSVMLEVGGQIADVDGNPDVYDSHLNYRDGFKVFGFDMRGTGEDGALLSDFYVKGGGWGNEPYSWVRFGFSRDKWFEFRGKFRESEYNWLFPGFARSQHLNDTERRLQTYNLTFFPKQKFRVKLGYKRNSSFGPTLTTFDFSRAEFPLFEPIRQTYDEYTIGAEWNIQRWLIIGEYGYRFFRNDRFLTIFDSPIPSLPNDTADPASLTVFNRLLPSRGKIPFFRVNVVGRPHSTVEVNVRAVYSDAESDFTRLENREGTSFSQGPANPSTTITEAFSAFGESGRPMHTIDANFTWRPVREFSISNTFQYHTYDISGFQDSTRNISCGERSVAGCPMFLLAALRGVGPNSFVQEFLWETDFESDIIRDRIEVQYTPIKWLTLRGGFSYLDRNWEFLEFETVDEDGALVNGPPNFSPSNTFPKTREEEIDTINRAWLAGLVLRPNRRIRIFFDLEHGNNTRVFNRQGPADLDRYRLRGRFEPWDGVRFNANWFIFDNQNFVNGTPANPDGRHSSRNRGFAVDFQLSRWQRGYVNAGYARNDVTAITDVVIPGFSPVQFRGGASVYVLDDNYWYVDAGGRIAGNLYVDAGYRFTDTSSTFPPSDPVGTCEPLTVQNCDNTGGLEALGIFDGGLNYHQPHVGVRYGFSDNVSWKFGWRYYDYNQEGGTFSDYDSHIVTTSVVLNF